MYLFCKYSDGTEVVFSNIIKNENGEETVQIHFERPTKMDLTVLDLNFQLTK